MRGDGVGGVSGASELQRIFLSQLEEAEELGCVAVSPVVQQGRGTRCNNYIDTILHCNVYQTTQLSFHTAHTFTPYYTACLHSMPQSSLLRSSTIISVPYHTSLLSVPHMIVILPLYICSICYNNYYIVAPYRLIL